MNKTLASTDNKPLFVMLVGIPGSGKSYIAEHLSVNDSKLNYVDNNFNPIKIYSSDKLRKELWGDESCQGNTDILFNVLHENIKHDMRNLENVVYDATNISKKKRVSFLKEISSYPHKKICISVMTPFLECVHNVSKRKRKVPIEAIRRMYFNWQPPHKHEGFDEVIFVNNSRKNHKFNIHEQYPDYLKMAYEFNQENEHHALSLGEHCEKAAEYLMRRNCDNYLISAAVYHDIGKMETKTRINKKGVDDGNCHYYQHHCVGAYLYTMLHVNSIMSLDEVSNVANIIYYHMHPYMSWNQSEKAKNKDKQLIGEKMFNDIMLLHEADLAAH